VSILQPAAKALLGLPHFAIWNMYPALSTHDYCWICETK